MLWGQSLSSESDFNISPPQPIVDASPLMHTKCMLLMSHFGLLGFEMSLPIGKQLLSRNLS
jgi:hypothetical protein